MCSLLIFAIMLVSFMHELLCVEEADKIKIITYKNENSVPGTYSFKYETSDGTYREETLEISNQELDNAVVVIHGSYSYISPDGQRYTVRYVADDHGFRPEIDKSISEASPNINLLSRIGGDAVSTLQGGGLG